MTRASSDSPVLKATWDLDHVTRVGDWELLLPAPDEEDLAVLNEVTGGASGTLVKWEKVDRVIRGYQKPSGAPARKALDKLVNEFREHTARVYQRFLDPEDPRARTVHLAVNDQQVCACDPFCEATPATEKVAERDVEVELPSGQTSSFLIRAFVLPRREEFGDEEAAGKAQITNDRQGLYIYRENRLIHRGDWLRMYRMEPHCSLCRVEFSFDHTLDEAFKIDIKKSQILLSQELYHWIRHEFLPAPRRAAQQRYRQGQRATVEQAARNAHTSSERTIAAREQELSMASAQITDEARGEVEIANPSGRIVIKTPIMEPGPDGKCHVVTVDSIDDGLLWEPRLVDGHMAVAINTGHPYYHRVYVPNFQSGVTVQGMDSLLWALCQAEWGTVTQATEQHCKDLRYHVSRMLRSLVSDLPEPEMDEQEDE